MCRGKELTLYFFLEALRGGRTELYRLAFKLDDKRDYKIYYEDASSLYPSVCLLEDYRAYPAGKYRFVIGEEMRTLKLVDGIWSFYREGETPEPLNGLVQVKIFPKENMWLPFIAIRHGLKSYYALCHACVTQSVKTLCPHSREERAWVSTITSSELNYASSIGYEFECYEALQFECSSSLFRSFMEILGSYKIRFSGFPPECDTLEKKQSYCDRVNRANGYEKNPNLCLTLENVRFEGGKRQFFKNCMNQTVGKFSQSAKTQSKFCTTRKELEDLFYESANNIKEFFTLGNDLMQVIYEVQPDFVQTSRKANSCLSSFVTAHGRIFMDKIFRKLESKGCIILYTDTG
ncbi:MAG TPA: DNA polymerase [Ignavibacteriaceae bacterium]